MVVETPTGERGVEELVDGARRAVGKARSSEFCEYWDGVIWCLSFTGSTQTPIILVYLSHRFEGGSAG
jgi:hypothetical protein